MTNTVLEIAQQALRDILDPIGYMERGLEEGYRLDGHAALQQMNTREFYVRLAREALAATEAAAPAQRAEPVAPAKGDNLAQVAAQRACITDAMIDVIAPYCQSMSRDLAHAALERVFAVAFVPAAPAHPPAQGVEDELTAFEAWFQRYRRESWVKSGCAKDRGPEPSENWSLGLRSWMLEAWQARAALAQAPAAEPLTDEQIIKCLQAAGVKFQRFYSPAKKRWLDSTAGSIDSSVLIEGVRGALAKEQP